MTALDPDPPDAGFAVLEDARVARVSGADARAWLHDLVTTDVASLEPEQARPSLLLTPTGRIRAMFQVIGLDADAFALVELDPAPGTVVATLSPYVLSSDVDVEPTPWRVIAASRLEGLADAGVAVASPSVLGDGLDVLTEPSAIDGIRDRLAALGLVELDADAVERRRIERARPRLGRDLDADSLPAEAGLDVSPVTDRTKGCFLGQEAIAKVANLGHPTRLLLGVRAGRPLEAGEPVLVDGVAVGIVTSVAGLRGLARVGWAARGGPLTASDGVPLVAAAVTGAVAHRG